MVILTSVKVDFFIHLLYFLFLELSFCRLCVVFVGDLGAEICMPLINRAVDCEPSKVYSTASRREMQSRLDRSYRVIERVLSARISRFDRAKSDLDEVRLRTSVARDQIESWNAAHKKTVRLPEKMSGSLYGNSYPWTYSFPSNKFSKFVNQRLIKHRAKLRSSIEDLRSYVDYFNERYAFIHRGFSWLELNPPKVNLVSEVQASFADLFSTEIIDGIEKLVLKDVEVLEAGEVVRRTIVSSDREEMIVSQPNEVDAVRKAVGIEVRPKSVPEGALVGDGVDDRAVFNLIGRMTEPGLLDAAVTGHFYKAGIESVDGRKLTYPDRFPLNSLEFHEKRDQFTNLYVNKESEYPSRMRFEKTDWGTKRLFLNSVYYKRSDVVLPMKDFGLRSKREPLEKDSRVVKFNDKNFIFNFQPNHSMIIKEDAFYECLYNSKYGIPSVLTGGPGSGKTTLITAFVSAYTLAGCVVKIFGGGGSLDVIENNIKTSLYLKVDCERFDDHLIVRFTGRLDRPSKFIGDGPHVNIVDEASLIEMRDEFLDPTKLLLVVGDLYQIAKPGSVLDWAERAQIPQFMLKQNYRAHNADTMIWSNTFSYETSMVMMAKGERRSGVRYVPLARKVNGVVREEARAVANAVSEALRGEGSVGIVAFSKKQLMAILDNMSVDDRTRLKFAGLPEDVQGKEADHVFVSTGAALTAGGKTPVRINGLEDEMGMARMNVALSRALYSNTVFSGLSVSDFDLRIATASQAILLSVLQTHEMLPEQATLMNDEDYSFIVAPIEPEINKLDTSLK